MSKRLGPNFSGPRNSPEEHEHNSDKHGKGRRVIRQTEAKERASVRQEIEANRPKEDELDG